ncbi:MAG: undecaprenyl-phosphate glucose phosphotransferase [Thermonemataceae bacterium]|nr:undecaprenyl-phosphate glucose phosphotransferase [Thermonemataceae bacterium]
MWQKYSKLVKISYLIGDLLALNIAFLLAYWLRFHSLSSINQIPYTYVGLYYNAVWLLIAFFAKTYRISRLDDYLSTARKNLRAIAWHFALVTVFLVLGQIEGYSRFHLLVSYLSFTVLVLLWRALIIWLLGFYRRSGYNQIRIVIVGYGKAGIDLHNFVIKNPNTGYQFVGFFDDKYKDNSLIKGDLSDLDNFVKNNQVDEIFCSLDRLSREQLKKVTTLADNHLKRIKLLPNLKDFTMAELAVEQYGSVPVVLSRTEPLNDMANQLLKRSFDIVFSLLVILGVFSWLFPLVALIIRIDSRGPIFFRQKRNGKDNKVFWVYKFRTMAYQKNATFVQATQNDTRITKIGKFLRKTSIDELPQFFNVLIGNMTVVGPRPHPLELNDNFKHIVEKYMLRHLVKPGVTGLAQVKGYRGETKDVRSMINRVKMDVFYIENWSFWLDIKIIFWTIQSVMKGDKNAF